MRPNALEWSLMNERQRKRKLQADLARFAKEYARKKRPGKGEPNDRAFDKELRNRLRRMRPEVIDKLLRDEEE